MYSEVFGYLNWSVSFPSMNNIKDTIAKLDQKVQKINKKDV